MRHTMFLALVCIAAVFSTVIITGCDEEKKSESGAASTEKSAGGSASFLGKYENSVDKISFELKEGGKVTIVDEGTTTELTWIMDGSDKVVINGKDGVKLVYTRNSDGNLSDGMGMVFVKK